jgi:hypothetical protein
VLGGRGTRLTYFLGRDGLAADALAGLASLSALIGRGFGSSMLPRLLAEEKKEAKGEDARARRLEKRGYLGTLRSGTENRKTPLSHNNAMSWHTHRTTCLCQASGEWQNWKPFVLAKNGVFPPPLCLLLPPVTFCTIPSRVRGLSGHLTLFESGMELPTESSGEYVSQIYIWPASGQARLEVGSRSAHSTRSPGRRVWKLGWRFV